MTHRISLHLTGQSAGELIAVAQEAEAAGVEVLFASELYTNPYVSLAAVAGATEKITLATGIVLAFTRSPLNIGVAALDLDMVCGGRLVLGLGTGVKRMNEAWHGVTDFSPPIPHMREVVEFIRLFNANCHDGAPLRYDGDFVKVNMVGFQRPDPPLRERIPIWLAATKPRMLELAGEIADGVMGHLFLSPRHMKEAMWPRIDAGLKRSGRSRKDITVTAGITAAIDDDRATARRHAAGPLAFYSTVRTYQPIFESDGFGAEVRAIRDAFDAGNKTKMIDLVSDEMIDTYCVAGTADDVLERMQQYDGLLDIKGVGPPRHFCPHDAHMAYRKRILELFANQ